MLMLTLNYGDFSIIMGSDGDKNTVTYIIVVLFFGILRYLVVSELQDNV